MFKVFQTNGDPKQQRGDGRIPLSPPLNETLLSAAGLSQGMLFTRLVQSSHALCHTSSHDGLSFFEVTPECQMFDANPNPISVTFSPVYQPPSSACSAPGLNNHTVQLNNHVAGLVAINFATPSIQGSTPPRDVALRNSFNAPGRALAAASVDSSSAKQPPKPFICLEATVRAAPNEGCCTEWTRPNRTWEGTQLGSTSDTTYGTTWGTTG